MKTESTVSTLIGKKIKILRRNAGYTASEFARLSGCKVINNCIAMYEVLIKLIPYVGISTKDP